METSINETIAKKTTVHGRTCIVSSFKLLALGARFRYQVGEKEWVKLSNDGTIAEWDDRNKCSGWLGQSICCFNEDNNFEELVHVC